MYGNPTDFLTKKKVFIFVRKNTFEMLSFLYWYFCIYWPIGAFARVFKFRDTWQTTIFDLLRKIWKTKPNLSFNWNHFEMRLFNLRINFFIYCGLFVLILVVFVLFFFHYVSAIFHLWPSSGDLPRPRIGMLSLVTVSPVITAFHSCCLSHGKE